MSLSSDEALAALRRKLTEQPTQDDIWVNQAASRIRQILVHGDSGSVEGTLRVLMDQARRPVKADGTVDLTVNVRLDPTPGAFHEPEDAVEIIQAILDARIQHYNPSVTLDTKE